MRIGIIGGGIIGLASAYYLKRAGCDVTVIDQGDLTNGCSFGNAGMIVPSHLIPLAAPGMISKGIRWMFNPTSPFYVKPALNWNLIAWGYHFYKSSTRKNVDLAIPALKEISLLSKAMYQQWATELPFDFSYKENGLLMLYKTKATEQEEVETAHVANKNGIDAHILSPAEVQNVEPDVKLDIRGGVYFPGDAHLDPGKLIGNLIPYLKSANVKFLTKTEVTRLMMEHKKLKIVRTVHGDLEFDSVIIAAGSWSGRLCALLGLSLPMQAGKGYSVTLPAGPNTIRVPSILVEARVAVTPMGSLIRFGGTMEITGIDHAISMGRVKGIIDSIPKYYPEIKPHLPLENDIWHGLRPCSPDGLPYVGRLKSVSNVILATGHSMMGLSLGAGTGKLVSEIVTGQTPGMDLAAFDPGRFN